MSSMFQPKFPRVDLFEKARSYCERYNLPLYFIMHENEKLPDKDLIAGDLCYCFEPERVYLYNGEYWMPLEVSPLESVYEAVDVQPLICERCGGQIDRHTMVCPYCDTQYGERVKKVVK